VGTSDARHYRMHGVPTVGCGLTAHNMGSFDEQVHIDELCALGEIDALSTTYTASDRPVQLSYRGSRQLAHVASTM
jgi:hypothetical protein